MAVVPGVAVPLGARLDEDVADRGVHAGEARPVPQGLTRVPVATSATGGMSVVDVGADDVAEVALVGAAGEGAGAQ